MKRTDLTIIDRNELLKILQVRRYEYLTCSFAENYMTYDSINQVLAYTSSLDNLIIEVLTASTVFCTDNIIFKDLQYMLDSSPFDVSINDTTTVTIDPSIIKVVLDNNFVHLK